LALANTCPAAEAMTCADSDGSSAWTTLLVVGTIACARDLEVVAEVLEDLHRAEGVAVPQEVLHPLQVGTAT
jgi:hypothetical protein